MAENYEGEAIGYPAEVELDTVETPSPNYVVTLNSLAGAPRLVDEDGNDLVTDDVAGTITVPGAGAGAFAVGNSVFVDVDGSDSTGTRERSDKPFLTLAAARTAATSGDTIFVRPGNYSVTTNLLKNGVNWEFSPGATVTKTDTGNAGLFDDSSNGANEPVTCVIGGNGSFYTSGIPADTIANSGVIRVTNASSNIVLHAETISANETTTTHASPAIFQSEGDLSVFSNKINGNVSAIWWEGGELYVRANEATCKGEDYGTLYLLNVSGINGRAWLDIQRWEATHINAFSLGGLDVADVAQIWIFFKEMIAPAGGFFADSDCGGKWYLNGQKISITGTATADDSINKGIFRGNNLGAGSRTLQIWANVQKLSGRVCGMQFIGRLNLDVLQIEDTTGETFSMFYMAYGELNARIGEWLGVTGDGFRFEAVAKAHIESLTMDLSAVAGSNPITIVTSDPSVITLDANVKLIAASGRDSIETTDPQTVYCWDPWFNTNPDANVTVEGNFNLNANLR